MHAELSSARLLRPRPAAGVVLPALMLLAFVTAGCGAGGGNGGGRAARVSVKGSDTMVILGQKWADTYMGTHEGAVVAVTGGGSGTGIAQLINAGLNTRIYYVTLNGFDTHSQQRDAHAGLLAELSGAVHAFLEDVTHQGHGERVLLMTFSEFGRRLKENASGGTDHGAAAPMFLAGAKVRSGLIGEHPSLTDLEDGDVKFHTDFRSVYASVLTNWLKWPVQPGLIDAVKPLDLFKA